MDADGLHGVADGTAAAHRPSRPVEGRQEPVAGRSDLSAAEAFEFGAGEAVVGGEQFRPSAAAPARRPGPGSPPARGPPRRAPPPRLVVTARAARRPPPGS